VDENVVSHAMLTPPFLPPSFPPSLPPSLPQGLHGMDLGGKTLTVKYALASQQVGREGGRDGGMDGRKVTHLTRS